MGDETETPAEPLQGRSLNVHQRAMLDAGRGILLDSLSVGREFCKFMIGFATGAVPIYLGLVKLFFIETVTFSSHDQEWILAPVFFFMVSAIFFVIGYMPLTGDFSLENVHEIEQQRRTAINWRRWWSIAGFLVFAIGVAIGSYVVVYVVPA